MFYDRYLLILIISAMLIAGSAFSSAAQTLNGIVKDIKGQPVADAVVYATPVSGQVNGTDPPPQATIDQIDKEYVNYVTPVKVGTAIFFPNSDDIRHHVYSFSPAKTFEIPLYPQGAGPSVPIIFDKPGAVVLGCNIHDWMKAYVYVVATPYFAVTDKHGTISIANLPSGEYNVLVWHPRMKKAGNSSQQQVKIAAKATVTTKFTLKLKKIWRPLRASKLGGGVYR